MLIQDIASHTSAIYYDSMIHYFKTLNNLNLLTAIIATFFLHNVPTMQMRVAKAVSPFINKVIHIRPKTSNTILSKLTSCVWGVCVWKYNHPLAILIIKKQDTHLI